MTIYFSTFTMNDEVVLCCIRIDSNGAIIMKPDFSPTSYFIQTLGFARGINKKSISIFFKFPFFPRNL